MKNIRVIGIDPGSRCSGYGIIESIGNRMQCVAYGCIRLPVSASIPKRLVVFNQKLREILDSVDVNIMAVESLFTAKNVQSVLKLGQFKGVALLIGAQYDLEIKEYPPATIKQSVVGYGRATKKQVQFVVQKLLKLPDKTIPVDAADALAVAICHINMNRTIIRVRGNQ